MARAKIGKIQSEAPRYNLKQLHKLQPTKINSPPENKNKYKRLLNVKTLKCTPPFCEGMPKGNQNPSSKGGGDEELRNRAKSARKPQISSRTSTKIYP